MTMAATRFVEIVAAVVCVGAAVAAVTPAAAAGPVSGLGLWGWSETVMDADKPRCRAVLDNLVGGPKTAAAFQGGSLHLSTGRAFICHDAAATARRAALPGFVKSMASQHGVAVNFLLGQRKDLKNETAVNAWVSVALELFGTMHAAGASPLPEFHFDIEYDATSADALRVIRMAESVSNQLTAAVAASTNGMPRPHVAWAVNTASIIDSLPTSMVDCPKDGQSQVIAKCMLNYVDTLTVMDYRSFAVEECSPKTGCDGIVPLAAPFLEYVASLGPSAGKTIAVAVETSCDLGTPVQWKISFCKDTLGTGCPYATADPFGYLLHTLSNVTSLLSNIPAATAAYPCATSALPTGTTDLWTGNVASRSPLVVEDFAALSTLAYGTDVSTACPYQGDWDACM